MPLPRLLQMTGSEHGIQGKDLGQQGGVKPEEVDWQDNGLEGKLDLVVTDRKSVV